MLKKDLLGQIVLDNFAGTSPAVINGSLRLVPVHDVSSNVIPLLGMNIHMYVLSSFPKRLWRLISLSIGGLYYFPGGSYKCWLSFKKKALNTGSNQKIHLLPMSFHLCFRARKSSKKPLIPSTWAGTCTNTWDQKSQTNWEWRWVPNWTNGNPYNGFIEAPRELGWCEIEK